jgi:hypothetical protein
MPKSPNRSCWFWGTSQETRATDFEAKPEKIVRVVLKPNHSQTVDLGFEAQPRNRRFSSSCARYRPHTMSPDLPIVRPLSIWPMRPSPVLCVRSHTPTTILIATRHAAAATCTPRDKQMWFSTRKKDKVKTTKMSQIQIQTSTSQWLITIKIRNLPLGFS